MSLRLRFPPLAVAGTAGFVGWIIARTFPSVSLDLGARTSWAAAFGLLGMICSISGVISFRRAHTTVNPLKPDAATALVISGIYQVTRNPMYLGFLLLLLGELVWLANPLALLAAPAFVLYLNRFQIGPEEQALRERFGFAYLTYITRVRRWI